MAIIRMPDDIPNANNSTGINPREPPTTPRQPASVSVFPE
jgi:hypothetical protein